MSNGERYFERPGAINEVMERHAKRACLAVARG
jgi:hypothetical protein